jgi:amino acid transporter
MHGIVPKVLPTFASSSTQLQFLTSQYWSSSVIWLIDLVVALSTLAFTISTFNAGTRLLFAMGRESMLPKLFGRTSHRSTPHMAIAGTAIFTLAVALPVTIAVGGFNCFAYIGGIAGVAFIVLYLSLNVGVIVAFRRIFRSDFRVIPHVVVPVLAILLFAIPLVGTFYPVPAYPYDILPYISLGWLLVGVVVAVFLAKRRPERLAKIGRLFIEVDPGDFVAGTQLIGD